MISRSISAAVAALAASGSLLGVAPAAAAPTCSPAYTGTPQFDSIFGDSRNNRICGLGSADDLRGRLGNDTIYGGGGGDVQIAGGPGEDFLFGNTGDDTMYGDAGPDHLDGGPGPDHMYPGLDFDYATYGRGGDDVIVVEDGGASAEYVYCGPGFDVAYVDSVDITAGCEDVRTDTLPRSQ